jgi:hypothetical protein
MEGSSSKEVSNPLLRTYNSQLIMVVVNNIKVKIPAFNKEGAAIVIIIGKNEVDFKDNF